MMSIRTHRRAFLAAAAASALGAPAFAHAEVPFPGAKPIRLIVPFGAGGSSDVVARAVGQALQDDLKQSVIIENRAGAGGAIGSDLVAKAAPDGYTLLLVDATHMTNPVFTRNIPFDAIKDFTAVGGIGKTPLFLVCRPNFPAQNVREMVDMALKEPGRLNIGIPGNGSIVFEMIRQVSKARVTVVPYKGTAPALVDLVGGQLDLLTPSISSAAAFVKNGQVRMLATTGPTRHPDYPDVPTFAEAGLPGVEYEQWFGVLGPAGLPAAVQQRLSQAVSHALRQPEVRARLKALALEPYEADAATFRRRMESEGNRWRKLAREAGIQPA